MLCAGHCSARSCKAKRNYLRYSHTSFSIVHSIKSSISSVATRTIWRLLALAGSSRKAGFYNSIIMVSDYSNIFWPSLPSNSWPIVHWRRLVSGASNCKANKCKTKLLTPLKVVNKESNLQKYVGVQSWKAAHLLTLEIRVEQRGIAYEMYWQKQWVSEKKKCEKIISAEKKLV